MSELFHGGVPGLRAGDLISPRPHEDVRHYLDDCPICTARKAGTPLPGDDLDAALVYATTSRMYARLYASGYPWGDVYRVEAVGPTSPSPDPEETESVGAPQLRVVAVLERMVRLRPTDMRRILRLR